METLTEIDQALLEKRQRALAYESLLGTRARLVTDIGRCEKTEPINTSELQQMLALAERTSPILECRTTGYIAVGGGRLIDGLVSLIRAAIADAHVINERQATKLAALRAELARCDESLKEFAAPQSAPTH